MAIEAEDNAVWIRLVRQGLSLHLLWMICK